MTTRIGVIGMVALLALPFSAGLAGDAGLGGSMASMRRQYEVAKKNDYTFLRTPAQVRAFVREDRLEPLESNEHLLVNKVSFPYARPEVKLFVERLAEQYHAATGERLVVTSLTRPLSRQPRNAHDLSVHPAGMAVDLRIPSNRHFRTWLENTLLSLEARELLDATRERRPPHYHVAVFPERYASYVANLMEREAAENAGVEVAAAELVPEVDASLEPSAISDSAHEPQPVIEPTVSATPANATVPLAASLGVAGVALVGVLRRRVRRAREERRSRVR